jgi:zinc D-Ala-D-Ala carboxypeptidase
MDRRTFFQLSGAGLLSATVPDMHAIELYDKDEHIKDHLYLPYPHHSHDEIITPTPLTKKPMADIILNEQDLRTMKSLFARLKRVQRHVGYGNFNLLSFDRALFLGRNYSRIGHFTKDELAFFEKLFYFQADDYGFYGDKVLTNLTDKISLKETKKIPYTGHYLYNGDAQKMYSAMRRILGKNIILTSGVRSIVKQMYLFLNKCNKTKGNLSIASRSLAPAGYSYHGIGDFDVGKTGYGYRNFTADFAKTDEYKRLMDLGYIKIRYTEDNPFGVRYEPWHIKVV